MNAVAAYVITLNEARYIERCVASLRNIADDVYVLDSGSTDGTQELAENLGAVVETHSFDGYAAQRNRALDRLDELFDADFIVTLDGDEYIDAAESSKLRELLQGASFDVGLLPRRVVFMDHELRWGNRRNIVLPRIFRSGMRYEDREVNEHVDIPENAVVEQLDATIVHDDGATWDELVAKHIDYAHREARIRAESERAGFEALPRLRHQRNRWIRTQIYERVPARVPLSFAYQYLARLGFLDGRAGLDRAVLDAFTEYSIDHLARRHPTR